MAHQYLNAFINNSATIREVVGADITNARHKVVMYDEGGNVELATSGDKAIGVILSDTAAIESGDDLITKAGFEVDILIKYIGLVEAAGAISKGDLVTVNGVGQVATAAAGDFVFGRAFTSTSAEGELAQVQINPAGYIPAA
ncbi:hypothetical protein LQZ18_01575 [Lachnospiraceae bacterium ZAX-1]